MNVGAKRYWHEKAIIFLFLLMVCMPSLIMFVTPLEPWSVVEKRKLAELPELPRTIDRIPSYLKSLDHFLDDHFGFRDYLIFRYYSEKSKRFGAKGIKEKVLPGRDGWLFFAPQTLLLDFLGKEPLKEESLQAFIAEQDGINTWLASQGIKYLLVSPPDKQSVYPEFLPPDLAKLKGTSKYEQLLQLLAQNPLPYFIDLQSPIRQAKNSEHLLFFKNDSHWNERGAYIAYQEIAKFLQTTFPGVGLTLGYAFNGDKVVPCKDYPLLCDLSIMALTQDESKEILPILETSTMNCARQIDVMRYVDPEKLSKKDKPPVASVCLKKKLKAVVFCDSFIAALMPFLSENFAEVIYLRSKYKQQDLIEIFHKFKPDILINERVERDLFR